MPETDDHVNKNMDVAPYTWAPDGRGYCGCCNTADVPTRRYEKHARFKDNEVVSREYWHLCEICSNSYISSKVKYDRPDAEIYVSMAQIGNIILRHLENLSA